VLLRDPYVPDAREILEYQLSEIDRMNELLTELLTLARLDAGKLAVGQEPFDLANVIAETAERFSGRAFAEGKRLEVRHSGKIPAWGDAGRTARSWPTYSTTPSGSRPREGSSPWRGVPEKEVPRRP
jgi:signal transduction histidine kinase